MRAKKLGWLGICFDTSGCFGQRDWELDWSFHMAPTPSSDQEMGRDAVEDLLRGTIEGEGQGPQVA